MDNVNKLFKLLEENTEILGSWNLNFNTHKECHQDLKEYLLINYTYPDPSESEDEFFNKEEVKSILQSETLYELTWYQRTPVGHIDFIDSTLEGIYKQVNEYLNNKG